MVVASSGGETIVLLPLADIYIDTNVLVLSSRYSELCLRLSQNRLGGVLPKRFKTMLLEKCQEVREDMIRACIAASFITPVITWHRVLLLLLLLLQEFEKDRSAILKAIQVHTLYNHYYHHHRNMHV